MDFNLDNLFNWPKVTVFSYSTELEFIILNLHLINEGITCPHCNNYTDTVWFFDLIKFLQKIHK